MESSEANEDKKREHSQHLKGQGDSRKIAVKPNDCLDGFDLKSQGAEYQRKGLKGNRT